MLNTGLITSYGQSTPVNIGNSENNGTKPNIIFILTDDQRWSALGYAGNDLVHTPAMDDMAENGLYFSHAMVSTPICAASRATILTGLYERSHRYDFQTSGIRDEFMETAYPIELRKAGYYTGFYGKFGVRYQKQKELFDVSESYDRNGRYKDYRGYYYKVLDGDTVHLTRYTGQKALDFIDEAPGDKPFCLNLSFSAPHAHDGAPKQYFWQKESDHLLEDTTVPDPELGKDTWFDRLPKAVRNGFNRTRWYWRYDTPEKYQHSVKGYYRMIAGIDREITKIREKLRETGQDQNTVIIVMGDNGYFQGERQLAGKWLMYDNSVRVPLIIYDPRHPHHRDIDQLALNVDIPSTILDLAGHQLPDEYQGKSLKPFLTSENYDLQRDTALIEHLWEFDHIPPSEGLRTGKWKYFRYVNDHSIEELYNLEQDPRETQNLAGDPRHKDIITSFRYQLDRKIQEYRDPLVNTPEGLMVELLREPGTNGVIDPSPEYSWIVPEGARIQQSYQILVSDSREDIHNNLGTTWNSGEVRSTENSNIAHQGKALVPGKTYYWKVRIWDNLHRLTDYSESQSFHFNGPQNDRVTTNDVFQVERIKPRSLQKTEDGLYLADFGKDAFATLEITYNTSSRKQLTIHLGEQLTDGRINREPQGNIRYQEVHLTVIPGKNQYQINLPPDKRNTKPQAVQLPDSFPVLMPFRYVEIEGADGIIKPEDLTQSAYNIYWNDDMSSFHSSDTILNQIWDLCKYSIKATSFAGLYVDGDRERIPYEADAYLNQLTHYAVDRSYPMARSTIEYFMDHPTWPTEWQLHVALMFWADYMYTGNTDLVEKYYDELKHKTLSDLARPDGLITVKNVTPEIMQNLGFSDPEVKLRDIVDWPPAQKDTGWKLATKEGERDGFVFRPVNTVVNAFYYRNLQIMAEFAELMNRPEEAEDFRYRAVKVKRTFNRILFDKEKGTYVDGEGTDHSSLHANMLPLAMGLVPEVHLSSVVDFIRSRGMACSVYGSQYLMDGLYKAGAGDYALELMTSKGDRSWWNMIRIGSTITLEAWDMKYKPNADWNHAWGAVPGNIIVRRMWGIQPKVPGGGVLSIKPQLASLTSSRIQTPFLKGEVSASYKKVNNRLKRFEFDLPANVVAELELQHASEDAITLNGKPVNMAYGTIRLSPGKNVVELKVNSF